MQRIAQVVGNIFSDGRRVTVHLGMIEAHRHWLVRVSAQGTHELRRCGRTREHVPPLPRKLAVGVANREPALTPERRCIRQASPGMPGDVGRAEHAHTCALHRFELEVERALRAVLVGEVTLPGNPQQAM